MEQQEEAGPPECPVCLTSYDAVSTVPRVIPCGHTICEACLLLLPHPFPNTIRCPACTQLVNFPNHPSSLPKNIDLLRMIPHPTILKKVTLEADLNLNQNNCNTASSFVPYLWSPEFYQNWIRWVIPSDIVVIDETPLYDKKCSKTSDNDDNSKAVSLVEPSSEQKNDGMILRICPNGDGEINTRSFEKEYYGGKIVKVDQNNSIGYGKSLFAGILRDNDMVGLVKVGLTSEINKENKLKYNCEAKVINFLYVMGNAGIDELGLVLNTSLRLHRMGKVYGFLGNDADNCVYMVCERFTSCLVEKLKCFERGLKATVDYMMMGAEMCEIVCGLHSEGLVVGCLSASCFGVDNFGRAFFDFGKALMTGRIFSRIVSDSVSDKVGIAGKDLRLRDYVLDCGVFASPELLAKMTGKKVVGDLGCEYSEFEICCGSDVWSLASLLVWLLTGKSFAEEMYNYYSHILIHESRDGKEGWLALYMGWMKKVTALLDKELGSEFVLLRKTICMCLEFQPVNRPSLNELWRSIKESITKSEIVVMKSLRLGVAQESIKYCIVLGELCQFNEEIENCTTKTSDVSEGNDDLIRSVENEGNSTIDKDIGEGVSKGKVKCIDLKGHIDCITALTVGGGCLFSSSYDKIVNVWCLQNFTHVLSLKGHEHRVMALVYVDETSLCIGGDNGGVICIWNARVPLDTEPIKKLHEHKDWRYSGIHAMAISGTQYLYTGSGDKTIKAWALQDYTFTCVMSGHKSVVSSLAVNNGVLYSGSWDGTVRLWSTSDHSPLAVMGEDTPSNISPVLALAAEHSFLFVTHEDGQVKIWQNDRLLETKKMHNGSVFAVLKKERWLFAGGWDKTISVQEVSGNGAELDISVVGYVPSESAITALAYWQGKLFVGQADKLIKVYYSSL